MGFKSYKDQVLSTLSHTEKVILTKVGIVVNNTATDLCPVGKKYGGMMRQKLGYEVYQDGQHKAVAVGTDVGYAVYVEKGTGLYAVGGKGRKTPWRYWNPAANDGKGGYVWTRGMKPQPFLEPAFMRNKDKIEQITKTEMTKLDSND